MSYQIHYRPPAAKALRKLDRQAASRILEAIEKLADNPRPRGAKQLKGGFGEMRIRIGDFRVVYEIYNEQLIVLVLRVGHRRDVYR